MGKEKNPLALQGLHLRPPATPPAAAATTSATGQLWSARLGQPCGQPCMVSHGQPLVSHGQPWSAMRTHAQPSFECQRHYYASLRWPIAGDAGSVVAIQSN